MAEYASGMFNKPAAELAYDPTAGVKLVPPAPPAAPDENTPFDPTNPAHVAILEKRNAALKAANSNAFIHPETGEVLTPMPKPAAPPPAANDNGLGALGAPKGGGYGGYSFGIAGDKSNFGKTPHQIADEKLTAEHLARMGGLDKEGANQAVAGEEEKASAFAAHYQKLQEMEAARLEAEKMRQTWVSTALEKHQQEAEALAKAEINPNHWWESKNTEQKITAGIGMALVAFGAGLSAAGGGDATFGMRAISDAIDRDIAAQKANLENRWQGYKAKQGLYSARLQAFQDERVAEASAKASAWELVGMKIRGIEAKSSSDMAKTQAKKLAEQADFMVDHYKNGVAMAGEQAYEQWRARMAAAAAAADKDLKEQNKKLFEAKLKYIYEKRKLGPNEQVVQDKTGDLWIGTVGPNGKIVKVSPVGGSPSGVPEDEGNKKITPVVTPLVGPNGKKIVVNAPIPEMATKMAKGLEGAVKFRRSIKRMLEIDANNGGAWVGGDLAAYKTQHGFAMTGFKDIGDLGALDVGVEKLTDRVLPDVPTWGVGKNFDSDRAQLKELLSITDDIINNTIERYGVPGSSEALPGPLQKKPLD